MSGSFSWMGLEGYRCAWVFKKRICIWCDSLCTSGNILYKYFPPSPGGAPFPSHSAFPWIIWFWPTHPKWGLSGGRNKICDISEYPALGTGLGTEWEPNFQGYLAPCCSPLHSPETVPACTPLEMRDSLPPGRPCSSPASALHTLVDLLLLRLTALQRLETEALPLPQHCLSLSASKC